MRFVMKHLSKKTLSVILALMVVLSTVAVAFSAIANPATDPYVVTLGKPALPMQVGKTLDLNAISVQFSETETVTGDQITWQASPGLLLDTSGYLTAMSTGTYKLTATKTSDAAATRTFYLFVKDAIDNDLVLYEHTFSTAELVTPAGQSYKKFADNSEWDVANLTTPGNYASLALGTMYSWPGVGATGAASAAFYIKPDSDAGRLIADFPNIVIDMKGINYSSARGGWSGAIMRANLGDNKTFDHTDTYISARHMSTSSYNATEKSIYRIFENSSSYVNSTTFPCRLDVNTHQYRRYILEGNTIIAQIDKNQNGNFTDVASSTYSNLTVTSSGTVGFYSDNNSRTIIDYFKVKITFTDTELASIENSYVTNNYFFVTQNKPVIPVELNKKVYLSNLVVEFGDGSFMMGSDVVWENNNGAIAYDESAKTFSMYAEGMFTIKAKKDATDAGTEIYLMTPNSENEYVLYEHKFSADDLINITGAVDTNGNPIGGFVNYNPNSKSWWGKYMATVSSTAKIANPDSDWALFNSTVQNNVGVTQQMYTYDSSRQNTELQGSSTRECYYWPTDKYVVVRPDDITANNSWAFTEGKGISINTNQAGWMYLKPDSDAGKLIGRFTDYTINYTYTAKNNNQFFLLGKYSLNNATYVTNSSKGFDLGGEQYLGASLPSGTTSAVYLRYSGNKYTNAPGAFAANAGSDKYNVKMKLSGNNVTLSYKKVADSAYTVVLDNVAAGTDVSGLKGTIAIQNAEGTRHYSEKISVAVTFTAEELANLQTAPVAELYNLTQDYPAVPMQKATMLDLSKVLVELPNGDFTTGDKLNWSTTYVGSNFFIDNTAKTAYAYGSGRYDVTVKNGTELVADVHFVVADDDGVYKIFEHTFTQADLDALSTGVSDMWISTRHVNSASTASYVNEITGLKDYSTDANKNGNADFEEGKGLSIYANEDRLLILNPAHSEAKVVSKFRDYAVGFTATKRTANNQGYSGDFYGYIGAVGRIDFGTDGIFQFISSQYNVSDLSDATKNLQLDHKFYGAIYLSTNLSTTNYATTEGWRQNNNLRQVNPYPGRPAITTYAIDVTKPYNYRISFKGRDIAMSVAPYGTASFTTLYDSALDTAVKDAYLADPNGGIGRFYLPLDSSNAKSGTIALYYNGASRAYYKDVYVAIEFDKLPELTSLGECRDTESRLLYLQVGQVLDLTQINFEEGDRYYNGALLTFAPVTGLEIVNGDYIKPTAEGVYEVTASTGSGSFTLTVAVSAAGSLFDNGNYSFTHSGGIITSYIRKDANKPFSQHVKFPANIDGNNIYELGSGLAGASAGNKEIVSAEIEKFIEKIGSGAFVGAAKLEKVTIANTVTEIGDSAFGGTKALKEIVLPGSVEKIGAKAFEESGLEKIIISNKDAVIGEKAFPATAVIYGFAGSTAEAYATANGLTFVALSGAEKTAAEASYNEWTTFKAERLTKVNDVEWIVHKANNYGDITYTINGFKVTDRTAGKFIVPATLEIVENGEPKTIKIAGIRNGENHISPFDTADGRAIYTLEFEEGIGSIGFQGFKNCYNIQSVTFPSSMTAIGWEAFSGTALTTVTIPDTIRTIGPKAFNNCPNLTEIKISENSMLQGFGTHTVRLTESPEAICASTQVTKMILPVLVSRITTGSFNSTKVKELYIYNKDLQFVDTWSTDNKDGYVLPAGIVIYGVKGSTAEEYATKWGHEFHEIPDFYKEKDGVADSTAKFNASFNGTSYVIGSFTGIGGKVVMPSAITVGGVKNAPVTVVGSSSFQFEDVLANGFGRIINLEISEGYVTIEDNAFKGASHLKSVKLPTSLKSIGKMAFASTGLEGTVEIPKGVNQIGTAAFRDNKAVTDIYIYNAKATIGANAFDATVTIHGVAGSTAEEYATTNNIKFVAIDKSTLTTSDFSDNGNYIFTVENGIITGYQRKDENKPYSLKVSFPAEINGVKITGIGEGVFDAGPEATSVIAVDIAKGITEIGARAFKDAMNLSYVSLPEGLKTIGDSAFVGTSLAGDIILPESLETIDTNAFKGALNLESITVLSKTVAIKANALPRGGQKTVVYVYTGSTAEEYCTTYKVNFDYLDGGPAEEEPGEEAPGNDNEGEENVGDKIEAPGDSNTPQDTIIYLDSADDLTFVIIIAVSLLLLVLLLAVAVVVVVVVKSKRNSVY